MGSCQAIDVIVVAGRALVLLIAALGGVFSIFLGWKLYKDVVLSKTEGNLHANGWSIKLAGAGPGVFFVAFGMWLLVKIVGQQVELSLTHSGTRFESSASAAVMMNVLPRSQALPEVRNLVTNDNGTHTRARTGGILAVADQSKAASSQCATACLIPRSHVIRFFSGPVTLTAPMADGALQAAVRSLEIQNRADAAASVQPSGGANVKEEIEILKQMRVLVQSNND